MCHWRGQCLTASDSALARVADDSAHYVYDGFRQDRDGAGDATVLTFDEAGNLTHRYLSGPAVDQILADEQLTSTSTPGNVLWPLGDQLGTIRDLADYNGSAVTVANHRVFDSFGQLTSETNAAVDHLFGFTGRELDEESGLYYYRARYYDPAIGQFVSEDPIGFEAGDANTRRYVGNGPLHGVDPSGLFDTVLPTNSEDGQWYDGPTKAAKKLTDKQIRAANGTGYYLTKVDDVAVKYTDGVVDFSRHLISHGGKSEWLVEVVATGISKNDISAAEATAAKMAKDLGISFPGMTKLNGTWHHLSFDSARQVFTFVLVKQDVHDLAKHSGGFARYLDWAADTLNDAKKVEALSDEMALAIHNSLQDPVVGKRLRNRINGFFTPKHVKILTERGETLAKTVIKGTEGTILSVIATRTAAGTRWVGRVVRRGVPFIGTIFVVKEASGAYATSGSGEKAFHAGARELTNAEIGEMGFKYTVVDSANAVGEYLMLNDTGNKIRAADKYRKHGIDPVGLDKLYIEGDSP